MTDQLIRHTDSNGIVYGWETLDAYCALQNEQLELYLGRLAGIQDPAIPMRQKVAELHYRDFLNGEFQQEMSDHFGEDVILEIHRSICTLFAPYLFQQIANIPFEGFDLLLKESRREGFKFLDLLFHDWESGKTRFDKNGEAIFRIEFGQLSLGIGGLHKDPFSNNPRHGRLRRFYLLSSWRKKGIGRALFKHLIQYSAKAFDQINLKTDSKGNAKFFERIGFQRVEGNQAISHVLVLPQCK